MLSSTLDARRTICQPRRWSLAPSPRPPAETGGRKNLHLDSFSHDAPRGEAPLGLGAPRPLFWPTNLTCVARKCRLQPPPRRCRLYDVDGAAPPPPRPPTSLPLLSSLLHALKLFPLFASFLFPLLLPCPFSFFLFPPNPFHFWSSFPSASACLGSSRRSYIISFTQRYNIFIFLPCHFLIYHIFSARLPILIPPPPPMKDF